MKKTNIQTHRQELDISTAVKTRWQMLELGMRKFHLEQWGAWRFIRGETYDVNTMFYYIYFEINGDPCNPIGPQQCDLFTNHTLFCSRPHLLNSSFINRVINVLNCVISDFIRTNFALNCVISVPSTQWEIKVLLFPLFNKPAASSNNYWYWLNSWISKWL